MHKTDFRDRYTELTKRAPEDPRGYSNRAAALIKLLAFPGALQDCNEAIKLDPDFVKAYLRKAQALFGMKRLSESLDVLSEAMERDEKLGGKNAREIEQQQSKTIQAIYSAREGETEEEAMKRIQSDPEILGVLQEPTIQYILSQAKDNPAALQDHMKASLPAINHA